MFTFHTPLFGPQKSDAAQSISPLLSVVRWSINLLTNGKNVCYKIDTGAQVNVLPKSMHKKVVDGESPPVEGHKVKTEGV